MEYEVVIGLEIHAQLKTNTKIFCGCSTAFGAEPNSQTCPVCTGMPGVLPVLNKTAVAYAARAGVATNCTINRVNRFARKNYFYPDLPLGYQITQFALPIAEHGHLDIELPDGGTKRIGITRIHMENDAGKLNHDPMRPISLVNLNRAGVPLIEIVSEPDMRSAAEAGVLVRKMHQLVRHIGVCDGNMEEGSLRCDANVSLRPKGQEEFGTRTEMKNLNSFRNIERAIRYEISRQTDILDNGGEVIQETRLWNADKEISTSMRSKEDAHDYRYFPDPDLLPVVIDDAWYDEIVKSLPELPDAMKARYVETLGLPVGDAEVLTSTLELATYFDACLAALGTPTPKQAKLAANWVMGSVLALLHTEGMSLATVPVSADMLAGLLTLVEKDVISGTMAKTVFEEMAATGKEAKIIVEEKGLAQVSDTSEIEGIVDTILANNPSEVEAFRGGKKKLMGFFVGQVMKATKGKGNPKVVNQLLGEKLK
ncbi:Asp-tRNA(Asn)/Glu-tRNA(Gln) amidotransferase subunit GatB [Desulfoluna sp.]|uniref:Asp-tRNA(Asn)/Glu-tRNA(Gln) amidotransferase subunit GatB n=1 Tax=Desulfoluna sp. TaxID=2045199 RepID=UPI002635DC42|nr:Asp-tRNA(Asn)/Glu-tRNA(Gln) amidotransferase subunit GatB [Desulfoluna sp.]